MSQSKWRFGSLLWRFVIRAIVTFLFGITRLAKFVLPAKRKLPRRNIKILLTGTFYSDNWILTHLRPLALAATVGEIRMVASSPVPLIDGVTPVYPRNWLIKLASPTGARLLTFAWESMTCRPDIVGGFHLLLNGLLAQMLSRISMRHCMYICGGGVREVEGGGFKTENKLFRRLSYSSNYVERLLVSTAADFDFLITMGSSVKKYFDENHAAGQVCVVPGGFDDDVFSPQENAKSFDLVTVGRLSSVKRVELLIRAVAAMNLRGLNVSAAIVGDGPSRDELRAVATELKILEKIEFLGWRNDVETWLRRSRVFTLTSESEGLSQAMIQGMLCGLPAVVSDVGDLGDLVIDGENGLLVSDQSVSSFSNAYESILFDQRKETAMSEQARRTSQKLGIKNVALLWDSIFDQSGRDAT